MSDAGRGSGAGGDREPGSGQGHGGSRGDAPRVPDDEPVLPVTSRDETDEGWGDELGRRDADWYRRERPPHHE